MGIPVSTAAIFLPSISTSALSKPPTAGSKLSTTLPRLRVGSLGVFLMTLLCDPLLFQVSVIEFLGDHDGIPVRIAREILTTPHFSVANSGDCLP